MNLVPDIGQRKLRITIAFTVVVSLFVLVVIKATYLQILNRDKLLRYSNSQIIREVTFYPDRGNVLDRNGSPLAINLKAYNLFVIPKLVLDKKVYSDLERIVPDFKAKNLAKKLAKKQKYTWIARHYRLSEIQAEEIRKLKGVFIEENSVRLYPNNEIMSQILGFVGQDNKGLSGSEYFFDKQLKGKPHIIKFIKDAKGRPLKTTSIDPGDPGTGLQLSLDLEIQANAEKQLRDAVIQHGAKMGGIGVMDADTGEILAIANYPSYDPNKPNELNRKYQRLSFITDPIEPGSIAKTFTIAASMESGLSTSKKKYFCERGQFKVGGHTISEAESKKKFEWLSVSEILEHSSNIGTTKIAFELGAPRLLYFFDKFGLGKKSGIEYAGESRGIMPAVNEITPLRLSNISFGQGMAVTPIQILSAYAIFANGGTFVQPTLLKTAQVPLGMRILSKETVATVTNILINAVEDGTGENAKIPLFKIAGKTSTTQRPSESGGYQGYIPGFVGFPVNTTKKYVVYVYIDHPTGKQYYGNDVAAPVFKKVMEHILIRDKLFINVGDAKPSSKHETYDQVVHGQSSVSSDSRVLPNFIGLDKQSIQSLIAKLPIRVRHHGVGLVSKQGPAAGTLLSEGPIEVDLFYEPPTVE